MKHAGQRSQRANMPWRVGSHQSTASTYVRWAATEEEAIKAARAATRLWVSNHPEDRAHRHAGGMPPASSMVAERRGTVEIEAPKRRGRPKATTPALPRFSTYRFICVAANPVAQVWQCIAHPGELANVGRPAKDGKAKQNDSAHAKGQCAVMLWKEPVRTPDGAVRVFSYPEALAYALACYDNADEDDRIYWPEDSPVVASTWHVDVCFDPACNGEHKPFNLFIPRWNHPVYVPYRKTEHTKSPLHRTGGALTARNADELAAIEFSRKLSAMAAEESREPSMKIMTFPSIWGAFEYAESVTEPYIQRNRGIIL